MGKVWRREQGSRNQRGDSYYDHLLSFHWLGKGREGWSSLDNNLGNLVTTLMSVCSRQSSSTLTVRTTALGVASMMITIFSVPMYESTSPTSPPTASGFSLMRKRDSVQSTNPVPCMDAFWNRSSIPPQETKWSRVKWS